MDPTRGAKTVLVASVLTAMLAGLGMIEPGASQELSVTAVAMAALLAGGLLLERSMVSAWHRTLGRADAAIAGLLFGLPLSFFILQNRVATTAGNVSMASGADRVVGAVGVVILIVAGVGAWRRRQRT